jgi:hypothetical protein
MSTALVVLLLTTLQTAPSLGQAQASSAPPEVANRRRPAPAGARLVPFAVATTAFDSNINHDQDDVDAYGAVLGGGFTFRSDPVKPAFELQYQAGVHRYVHGERWNRLSHYVRAQWSAKLTRRIGLETVGEASIKGSTEDQELSNQFAVSPRLEFRLTRVFRARAYGTLRLKRYEDDPTREAFNRYAGTELVGRHEGGTRWSVGGRYEWNGAVSERQQYLRWTWYGDVARPLGSRDRVEVGTRHRIQHYPHRLVDVPRAPDVPRHDTRWEPSAAWVHAIDADIDLRLGYAFSGRRSNDARRDYQSHNVTFSVVQRW